MTSIDICLYLYSILINDYDFPLKMERYGLYSYIKFTGTQGFEIYESCNI